LKRTVYFIEGLPGTGKSTISKWLHEKTGAKCILESDLNYPNDLCNVAGLPLDVYNKICCDFPIISDFIEQHGMYIYVNIQEVRSCFPNQHELLNIISEWDIGDEFNTHMTLSHYIPCSLAFFNNRFTQLEQNYHSIIFTPIQLYDNTKYPYLLYILLLALICNLLRKLYLMYIAFLILFYYFCKAYP